MNRFRWLPALLAVVLAALLTHAAGCIVPADFDDCFVYPHAGCMGAADGGQPPTCDPSQNPSPVDDTCGVFVSPAGDDGNVGTKAKPLKTMTAALGKGSAVYACAGTTPFSEVLLVNAPVTIFGALDCATWAYQPSKKTALTAPADMIPLTLARSAGLSLVHDIQITAVDATMAGGSSIALLDDHGDLTLVRVDVVAGRGAAGPPGPPQAQVTTPPTAAGGDGNDNMCGATTNGGGNPGQNMCFYMGSMMDTSGGTGGTGTSGTAGTPGTGGNPMSATTGTGGKAQDASGPCATGGQGNPGSPGMPGTGARGIGSVDASGYHGPLATAGMTGGSPGQGGGGGGGAAKCSTGGSGPGGGGGGAGGCPGAPGNPGQSGGSSFGILALGANLTLATVTISTKAGAAGGLGGDGQQGGPGGSSGHAPMNSNACDGNKGGAGGRGGSGGGGAGGHSAGIAIAGGALPDLKDAAITHDTGGPGGAGGDMDGTLQTKGDNGLGCATLEFTDPTSPTACMK
jgi:hypothetical protein